MGANIVKTLGLYQVPKLRNTTTTIATTTTTTTTTTIVGVEKHKINEKLYIFIRQAFNAILTSSSGL